MPFALLIIGILLLVSAINNTQADLMTLMYNDFTGPANFVYWIIALVLIGAVGYIEKLKPLSDALLVAIILALLLSRGNPKFNQYGGFFKQLQTAIGGTTGPNPQSTVSGGAGGPGVNIQITPQGGVYCPPGIICDTQGRPIGSVPPGGAPPPIYYPPAPGTRTYFNTGVNA